MSKNAKSNNQNSSQEGFDLFDFIDSPKNRQVLIGFSIVLILCYSIFTLLNKEKKVVQTPTFQKPKYYKKNQ